MSALLPAPVETRALASLGTTLERGRTDATRQAAADFEGVFISQMLEPMFQGLKTDGMFGGGSGEQVFRSLMIQEVGKQIAGAGGVGIADSVYAEMLRMQGLKSEASSGGAGFAPALIGTPGGLSDAVLDRMMHLQMNVDTAA